MLTSEICIDLWNEYRFQQPWRTALRLLALWDDPTNEGHRRIWIARRITDHARRHIWFQAWGGWYSACAYLTVRGVPNVRPTRAIDLWEEDPLMVA